MRYLVALMLVLALTNPCFAGFGTSTGGAKDWFQLGEGGEWVEQDLGLLGGASFHIAMDGEVNDLGETVIPSTWGLTVGFRGTSPEDLVGEYSLGAWKVKGPAEFFADAKFESWSKEFTGSTEFLWGGRAGIRFDVGPAPLEASAHWAQDGEDHKHAGLFFGLHVEN